MKAVDDATLTRVERHQKLRAIKAHEAEATKLRSELGLLTREKYETIEPRDVVNDGVTRMRTDQVDRLYETGKINANERAAALKYRTVFEALGRGLFPASRCEPGGGSKSRGTFRHPLERMTSQEFFIWINEYKPWANGPAAKTAISREARNEGRLYTFKRSFLQICHAVVIDGYGPNQLENQWPIPRGHRLVSEALQRGLAAWKHLDYNDGKDLDHIRRKMIDDSRAALNDHPAKR